MSLVLLLKMRDASWKTRGLFAIFNVLMMLAFVGHYFGVARQQIDAPQAQVAHEHMDAAWRESFPPDALSAFPLWLMQIHSGLMLAYPIGGTNGGSSVSLLLCILGAWHLSARGQRSLLLACVLPFGMTMLAAFLHKYPYGGSARVAQHLAPMTCLLIAAGAAHLLERLRTPSAQWRWACGVCLLLAAVGLTGAVRDACRPHKSDYDRCVRELVLTFWTRVEPGDAVVLGNPVGNVPMVAEWYLRQDHVDVCRPDSPQFAVPARGGVWLWFFSAHAPEPSAALWVLGARGQGLAVVESQSWMLPSDSPGDPPVCCTLYRLAH